METAIAIVVLLLLVVGALFYIIRAKKRGAKCIGCPYAKSCQSHCCCQTNEKKDV